MSRKRAKQNAVFAEIEPRGDSSEVGFQKKFHNCECFGAANAPLEVADALKIVPELIDGQVRFELSSCLAGNFWSPDSVVTSFDNLSELVKEPNRLEECGQGIDLPLG